MINKKLSFAAYSLTKSNRGNYQPPLEQQLDAVFAAYKERFGVQHTACFVGPITDEFKQVLVRDGEVWLPIPERKKNIVTAVPPE